MKKFVGYSSVLPWFMASLLSAWVAGCGGGGRDAILGIPTLDALVPPTVTAVVPVNNATVVAINNTVITAAFSEAMAPITGTASFTVTCAAPCVSPAGATVALDATNRIATYTLAPATALAPLTLYTATVTGARSLTTGLALASPFVWQFTTGPTPDTTRPRVTLTSPATTIPGPTAGVPTNTAITAVFTENMAPATIVAASFTLTCAPACVSPSPAGLVSYTVASRTAVFTPAAALEVGKTYTATITTAATDLAGNALAGNQAALPAASNYVWTFTPAAPAPAGNVSVFSTNPVAGDAAVCPNATINATFSVPSGLRMNPATVNAANFTVTGPAPASAAVTAASVALDSATGRIATFTPLLPLVAGVTYTAVVKGGATGVKDLAIPANAMVGDFTWNFTAAACLVPPPPAPVALGTVSRYGIFGGSAGMTNTGNLTVITGSGGNTADIGTIATGTSSVTGFHDSAPSDVYTEVPGVNVGNVTGKIFTCTTSTTGPTNPTNGVNAASCALATQARLDAQTAYLALVAKPGGPDPGAGNLANLVLTPGVYTSNSGSFLIEGGNLTLDAQGDANAVFVFQMASTLTVGGPGAAAPQSVILVGGALAKNVFWQVGSAAIINAGGGGTMVGTIISQAGAAFSTAGNVAPVTLNGRALSLGASVTLVNTFINVPAP
nr:ice-binding family protein [Rhodoferax sp.]